MAHRFLIFMLFTGLLLSCKSDAQSWNQGITGEGEIVKESITLESLKGIDLGFFGDVVLTPGNTQKITLEGQKNIIDIISRKVKNGIWDISFDKNVKDAKQVTVYITLPGLEDVGMNGSGSIRSTGKFSGLNELNIYLSGSGNIQFEYEAKETNVSLSGSGKIDLKGASKEINISISGSGNVKGNDLQTEDCRVSISGSGDASVQANKNLVAEIAGSGDISYSGSASVVSHVYGSGEVSKIR